MHFGNATDEFAALRSTCGVYNLENRAKIQLTGSDRVRWLNGMITNNVRDLTAGHGVYGFLLNPQGHILGDLIAYNRGEHILVDTDQSQLETILATFDHYIIMDDVEVANISDKLSAIGLTGPNAGSVLKVAGFEVPELKTLQIADLPWQEKNVSIVCGESVSFGSRGTEARTYIGQKAIEAGL